MKKNWFGIVLLLSLCICLPAQQIQLKSWIENKGPIDMDSESIPQFEIQAAGEKSLLLITETISLDENLAPLDGFIKINNTGEVYFAANVLPLANQNVRFTFIWIGSEVLSFTTDWYSMKKRELNYAFAGGARNNWTKGVYKMLVFAESNKPQAGTTKVAECNVWFY